MGTEKINGHPDFDYNEDSVKVLKSPKGTTFVIPNTGGTKAYDAIYGYSLEHIKAVRPKLSWLTQAQLEHDGIGRPDQRRAQTRNYRRSL